MLLEVFTRQLRWRSTNVQPLGCFPFAFHFIKHLYTLNAEELGEFFCQAFLYYEGIILTAGLKLNIVCLSQCSSF